MFEESIPDVSIIDYGINNLKSVSKAFEKIGKNSEIIDKPEQVLKAKCLILPRSVSMLPSSDPLIIR